MTDSVAIDAKRILLRYGAPIAILDKVSESHRIEFAREIAKTNLPERERRLRQLLGEHGYTDLEAVKNAKGKKGKPKPAPEASAPTEGGNSQPKKAGKPEPTKTAKAGPVKATKAKAAKSARPKKAKAPKTKPAKAAKPKAKQSAKARNKKKK